MVKGIISNIHFKHPTNTCSTLFKPDFYTILDTNYKHSLERDFLFLWQSYLKLENEQKTHKLFRKSAHNILSQLNNSDMYSYWKIIQYSLIHG